ncbi:hypothetical protein QUB60_12625 [Microcoleus sp. A2-C5]|uniref:hypothetical protein n=1 Tax=unclassified Microcoleus TaxID=2642155 RepID=UPI002FD21A8D
MAKKGSNVGDASVLSADKSITYYRGFTVNPLKNMFLRIGKFLILDSIYSCFQLDIAAKLTEKSILKKMSE